MTAKKERGVTQSLPRTQALSTKTIAYAILQRLYEQGTLKPAQLFDLMPDRRQHTAQVFVYVERLTSLYYAHVTHTSEITITPLGRAFIEDKLEPETPKHVGIPAAPRAVSIWTPPMQGYEAAMRAGRRTA